MDIVSLLDELDALLQRSIRVPASGKVLVDENSIRQIIAGMRAAAPDELRMGQRLSGERERILADAKTQARRMVDEAQSQAIQRIDEQSVVQAARERARAILAEAEQQAGAMQAQSSQYTLTQLSSLEQRLQRMLREVQAGQRFLTQGDSEGPTRPGEAGMPGPPPSAGQRDGSPSSRPAGSRADTKGR